MCNLTIGYLKLKIVPKARIIFAIIFTAFFLSCDIEDENPEYIEALFFDTERIDLTGTWDLYFDWYCVGDPFSASITLNSDGTFLGIEGWIWSGQAGTVSLDGGSGECGAVTFDYNASFLFDSTGTIYYLSVDEESGDNASGPIDDGGNGRKDGEFEMIKQGDSQIIVTSPNGGETWELGSTHDITWTSQNPSSSYVNIKLYRSGSFISNIAGQTSDNGSYTWSISSGQTESSYYQVRIEEYGNSSVYDESNNYFSIEAPSNPTITVTSPNGGEEWEPGSSHAITWSSANLSSSNVTIKLYKNGSYNSLLSSYTTNDGSYTWTISSSLSESDYYKIRIEEYNNSSVYDESDNYFTISSSGSSGTCDDCLNDYTDFGSECCDTAWEEYSLSCAELESTYGWDCSGCNCPGDSDGDGGGDDGSSFYEDFEDISDWTNTTNSSAAWFITTGYSGNGAKSICSGYGYGDTISRSFSFPSNVQLSFWFKRVYVGDYNNLYLVIDGTDVWSGTTYEWEQVQINVSSGTHTISFETRFSGAILLDELTIE